MICSSSSAKFRPRSAFRRAQRLWRPGALANQTDFTPAHRDTGVSEPTPVERWQAALEEAGELTPDIVERISRVHGDRGLRAIEAVGAGRVKVYRDFTVVVGNLDEYVVEGGGCTCKDSEYNLDPDDPTQLCWHVLAVAIARRIGHLDYHDMWYSDVREFL